jgi:hypothetical protein
VLKERQLVLENLISTGRYVIKLSLDEVSEFAGNCLELERKTKSNLERDDTKKKPLLAISSRALRRLSTENRSTMETFVDFVECNVDTIEHVGGGGIRCMIAGIHLPDK